jgi:hypothetical protein
MRESVRQRINACNRTPQWFIFLKENIKVKGRNITHSTKTSTIKKEEVCLFTLSAAKCTYCIRWIKTMFLICLSLYSAATLPELSSVSTNPPVTSFLHDCWVSSGELWQSYVGSAWDPPSSHMCSHFHHCDRVLGPQFTHPMYRSTRLYWHECPIDW